MKFFDLYCKNDSLHAGTIVTIVDQHEKPIFHGTFDELDLDFVGNVVRPVKNTIAQWATWYATVSEYHIVSVSTTAPDDVCAVPLTNGVHISELYVKVNSIDKLRTMLNARGLEWDRIENNE